MESQTVTLVMGTYNPNIQWIERALMSSENLFDAIIVVDDGSDLEEELMIITKSLTDYIFLRHDENKGFYQTRNTGIAEAKTEWIASLDDDDEFIRENVDKLKEFIKITDADIVSFPIELFGTQTGYWGHNPNMENILMANQIPSGSWFRKKVWEKVKGFQIPEGDDWDFWARAKKHGFKFAYFPLPVYRHRMRPDSMSAVWVGDKFISLREQIRKRYDEERV